MVSSAATEPDDLVGQGRRVSHCKLCVLCDPVSAAHSMNKRDVAWMTAASWPVLSCSAAVHAGGAESGTARDQAAVQRPVSHRGCAQPAAQPVQAAAGPGECCCSMSSPILSCKLASSALLCACCYSMPQLCEHWGATSTSTLASLLRQGSSRSCINGVACCCWWSAQRLDVQVHADMKSGASLVLSFDAGPEDSKDGLLRPAVCKAHAVAGQSRSVGVSLQDECMLHARSSQMLPQLGCTRDAPMWQSDICCAAGLQEDSPPSSPSSIPAVSSPDRVAASPPALLAPPPTPQQPRRRRARRSVPCPCGGAPG